MPANAATLDDVEQWWSSFEDYSATLVKAETAAWRFRVKYTPTGRETDVLIPFVYTSKTLKDTITKLQKFFQVFR